MTADVPPSVPIDDFTLPAPVHYPPPLADVGQRFLARLIDGFIAIGLAIVLLVPGALLSGKLEPREARTSVMAGVLIAVFAMPLIYEAVMTGLWGATLGKRIMKLRVVRIADAGRVGWAASIFRPLTYWIFSIIPCVGYLDPLWCLWDRPNRQTLHDKCVRTIVIRLDNPPYGELAYLDDAPVDWRAP